jgi:hypothetical protein
MMKRGYRGPFTQVCVIYKKTFTDKTPRETMKRSTYRDERRPRLVIMVSKFFGLFLFFMASNITALVWPDTLPPIRLTAGQPLHLEGYDGADTMSEVGAYEVTSKDTVPPSGYVSTPQTGSVLKGIITINVNASDSSGIKNVQILVDGSPTFCKQLNRSPYTCNWDTRQVKDGQHVLTAVLRDAANNAMTTAQVGVLVQNSATPTTTPSLTIGQLRCTANQDCPSNACGYTPTGQFCFDPNRYGCAMQNTNGVPVGEIMKAGTGLFRCTGPSNWEPVVQGMNGQACNFCPYGSTWTWKQVSGSSGSYGCYSASGQLTSPISYCQSGRCQSGPGETAPFPNGKFYCTGADKVCALPYMNGAVEGELYQIKGVQYQCHQKDWILPTPVEEDLGLLRRPGEECSAQGPFCFGGTYCASYLDGKSYCVGLEMDCALPNSTGFKAGTVMTYNGFLHQCRFGAPGWARISGKGPKTAGYPCKPESAGTDCNSGICREYPPDRVVFMNTETKAPTATLFYCVGDVRDSNAQLCAAPGFSVDGKVTTPQKTCVTVDGQYKLCQAFGGWVTGQDTCAAPDAYHLYP